VAALPAGPDPRRAASPSRSSFPADAKSTLRRAARPRRRVDAHAPRYHPHLVGSFDPLDGRQWRAPIAPHRETAPGSRSRAQDRQMRRALHFKTPRNAWLIPVRPGKPERLRHRTNDGWRATAELRRLQASSVRRSRGLRPGQRLVWLRCGALVLFTLVAVAGVYSKHLSLSEVVGIYLGFGGIGWLPVPKGPWSDVSRGRTASRAPVGSQGARVAYPRPRGALPRGAGAKPRQRRARRAGRARRRARPPAGRR
jgi:hypothetical protein